MMQRIANAGLRTRVIAVVLLAAAPVVGLLSVSYLDARRTAAARVQESSLRLARLASLENERLIAGTRYLLFALANEVRREGPGVCVPFLAGVRERYPFYTNFGVAGLDGTVTCTGITTQARVNLADRRYFKRAVETHDFAGGEYQIDRFTGRGVLAFGYPVINDAGAVTAVVFGGLDLSWLTRAAAQADLPGGSTVLIVDRNGVVLAHYPDAEQQVGASKADAPLVREILTRREGVATLAGLDGVSRLYGFAPLHQAVEENVAYVAVGLPVAAAFHEVNRLVGRNAMGMAAIFLVALCAAWFGSGVFVLRPVRALVGAATRLREGDLTARTGLVPSGGEIGQLTRAFDEMAATLQDRDVQLRSAGQQFRATLDDARRRLARLRALRAIDVAILESLDLRRTLNVVVSKAINELRVDAAGILLFDAGSRTLECVATRGFRAPMLQRPRIGLGDGPPGRAAHERVVVRVPDLPAEPRATSCIMPEGEGFVAYWAVPLVARDRVTGVLELFHRAPLDPDEEWSDFLNALAGQAAIAIDNARLLDDIRRTNADLVQAYDATLEGWSRALDLRDRQAEGHTQRVAEMTLRLAEAMGVPHDDSIHMRRGALLHDIGKMGVPDRILSKSSPLTPEEFAIMRRHPVYAHEMLSPIAFLRSALEIPYAHHEKWDGTGYPRGLRGDEIPLAARIFAVIDTWDALRSDRPYRPAWSEDRVLGYLSERAGRDFDPRAVAAFLKIVPSADTDRTPAREPVARAPRPAGRTRSS